MKRFLAVVAALMIAGSCGSFAWACSTFAATRGPIVVGHSFDYIQGSGVMMVNKRKVAKQALLRPKDKGKPLRWLARYGSVTFNMVSREMPLGGMNETGLVVQQMWFSRTKHPPLRPGKPTVNELQLIQYVLDVASSTKQALRLVRGVQIARGYGKLHYLLCDRRGACAAIEYIDGNLVVHEGRKLQIPVLTNESYAASMTARRDHLKKDSTAPKGSSSHERFIRAATLLHTLSSKDAAGSAYALIESLRQQHKRGGTQWQIVYQPRDGVVHFRNPGDPKPVTVSFAKLDFSCRAPVRVLDLRGDITGKRTNAFVDYKREHNVALLSHMFNAIRMPLPPPAVEAMARYPEQATRCTTR